MKKGDERVRVRHKKKRWADSTKEKKEKEERQHINEVN